MRTITSHQQLQMSIDFLQSIAPMLLPFRLLMLWATLLTDIAGFHLLSPRTFRLKHRLLTPPPSLTKLATLHLPSFNPAMFRCNHSLCSQSVSFYLQSSDRILNNVSLIAFYWTTSSLPQSGHKTGSNTITNRQGNYPSYSPLFPHV